MSENHSDKAALLDGSVERSQKLRTTQRAMHSNPPGQYSDARVERHIRTPIFDPFQNAVIANGDQQNLVNIFRTIETEDLVGEVFKLNWKKT